MDEQTDRNMDPQATPQPVADTPNEAPQEAQDTKERKGKRRKEPLTPQQKKKRTIKGLIITAIVIACIGVLIGIFAIVNVAGVSALTKLGDQFSPVAYAEGEQLVPTVDEDGYYTFVADRPLNVLQFTDIHIGAGFGSQKKDAWALNAVATMISAERPDLVIVTGDIAFPVPYAAGTFNNLNAIKIFANLMEQLEVYWTFVFGNHDTEIYSMYTRSEICNFFEDSNFRYCLFKANNDIEDEDERESFGYGNNIIKVKNSQGIVTQALVGFDSHSYTDGDYFGALWRYDNIHVNQIEWYQSEMQRLNEANSRLDPNAQPIRNMAFFHIPLREYRRAWSQVMMWAQDNRDSKDYFSDYDHAPDQPLVINDDITYHYGVMAESDKTKNGERTWGVFCGVYDEEVYAKDEQGNEVDGLFFRTAQANGMQAIFCGHDHYNNFSIDYKGIRLTYGMSIDYLAYSGIWKEKSQRGCTRITVQPDGGFDVTALNYYRDFTVTQEH